METNTETISREQALRTELAELQAQFDEAGGRGVDLAERIDDILRELGEYEGEEETITLEPRQTKKDTFFLAHVPMPDSIDMKEGTVNRLKIEVRYDKDGFHRGGRGVYLHIQGETYDGTFVSFLLMQDPHEVVKLADCKRFSKKALEKAVDSVGDHMDFIMKTVRESREYYKNRGTY